MPEIGESVFVPGPNLDEPPPKTDEQTKREKKVKVRISLFFDGTANNRVNTDHRLHRATDPKSAETYKKYGDSMSYTNDHSNVSRLETKVKKKRVAGYDHFISVYTEGIGTTDSNEDTVIPGQAFGDGDTGVKAKVDKGLRSALGLLQSMLTPEVTIEKLSVDTFGFSRGAAGARYCIHRALHDEAATRPKNAVGTAAWSGLKTSLESIGHTVEAIEVKAVGLFDTVASLGLNHSDDTKELKLDAIRRAKAVLQLAAAEEYRTNFPLTNIDSAGSKGCQIYLPGSHSDVGGGYTPGHSVKQQDGRWKWIAGDVEQGKVGNDGGAQDLRLIRGSEAKDIAKFLLDRGWYTERELKLDEHGRDRVLVKRAGISQKYSFIPLRLMAGFAAKHGLPIDPSLYSEFDPQGVPARARIEAYAAAGEVGFSSPTDWESDEPELRALRHGYLHISFYSDIAMHVQTAVSEDTGAIRPHREVYPG